MRAILMAAGRGTRISRMVAEVPKSTLPINGVPLIKKTVEMLQSHGISVTVCVGYKSEIIKDILAGLDVDFFENPFYDVTNSIASLWFAQQRLQGDMLVMNADVYFNESILEMILSNENEAVMAIDNTRIKVGDFFFLTTDNGSIIKYGKELPLEERSCEYVGIAKISAAFCPLFKERLNLLISRQHHGMWWENILYSFTDTKEFEIKTIDVNGEFWAEIDYFDDYERIINHIRKEDKDN